MQKLFVFVLSLAVVGLLGAKPIQAGGQPPAKDSMAMAMKILDLKVSNFNFGCLENVVMTGSNTGLNDTFQPKEVTNKRSHHHHNEVGDVTSSTGDAEAYADVSTNLNYNSVTGSISDFSNGPVAANSFQEEEHHHRRTQDGKPGFAMAMDYLGLKIANFNMGGVVNFVMTGANTGMNETGKGSSETGDATAMAMVGTNLNKNSTTVEIKKDGTGSLALNTGNKGGVAMAMDVIGVEVFNMNTGSVVNMVGTAANSGVNVTTGNSSTGAALAAAIVGNNVNYNGTSISITDNSKGPVAGNVSGAQDHEDCHDRCGSCDKECGEPEPTPSCLPEICGEPVTGPAAVNSGNGGTAIVSDVTTVDVANVNVANVDNVVGTVANTGGNTTTGSTENVDHHSCEETKPAETSSSTGDATAGTTVSNNVNANVTDLTIVK